MKGILICGGTGSRLRPLTDITNKSLLPVYDRPLIEYPLKVLRDAGIREIAVITGPDHIDQITSYLGQGERFDCRFTFTVQEQPGGIAQALGLAESFAKDESICAILGDNVYFDDLTLTITSFQTGGHVFLKEVEDAKRFGVAELSGDHVTHIEEKPASPKSPFAVTGLYLYDRRCFDVIRELRPSARGELEISDLNNWYAERNELTATILKEEWVDAGTFESLFHASALVRTRSLATQKA